MRPSRGLEKGRDKGETLWGERAGSQPWRKQRPCFTVKASKDEWAAFGGVLSWVGMQESSQDGLLAAKILMTSLNMPQAVDASDF